MKEMKPGVIGMMAYIRNDPTIEERSFPEDSHLENGNYFNTCGECHKDFVGYKRRPVCKKCLTLDSSPKPQTVGRVDLSGVKRYKIDDPDTWTDFEVTLSEDKDGEWVAFNDLAYLRAPADSPKQTVAVGVEKGHWWCPSCKEAVIPQRVTFQENHDTCGHPVEWVEFTTTDTRVTPATQDYLQSRTTTQSAPSVGSVPTVETFYSISAEVGKRFLREQSGAWMVATLQSIHTLLTSRMEVKP